MFVRRMLVSFGGKRCVRKRDDSGHDKRDSPAECRSIPSLALRRRVEGLYSAALACFEAHAHVSGMRIDQVLGGCGRHSGQVEDVFMAAIAVPLLIVTVHRGP